MKLSINGKLLGVNNQTDKRLLFKSLTYLIRSDNVAEAVKLPAVPFTVMV